jgi:AP2-associated kinase
MNRRLRERLTEAEILQIFVDVCEGVAAMHNLRPALLHRDLKVYLLLLHGLRRRVQTDPIVQSFN